MKKSKLILIIPVVSILLSSASAYAQEPLKAPPENIDVVKVLDKVAGLLISIATPIAIIMVIIAGFYFMTAQGDPGKIDTAKKMLMWVLIGMAVVLLAKAAISLVVNMAAS